MPTLQSAASAERGGSEPWVPRQHKTTATATHHGPHAQLSRDRPHDPEKTRQAPHRQETFILAETCEDAVQNLLADGIAALLDKRCLCGNEEEPVPLLEPRQREYMPMVSGLVGGQLATRMHRPTATRDLVIRPLLPRYWEVVGTPTKHTAVGRRILRKAGHAFTRCRSKLLNAAGPL